ncbi:MAG TPA: kelch repeat-containing protein, partial [Kofleriaceae bacterium]|nr:kelch repeat-containing protein [Kofleriaceae bacterium]
MFLHGQLRGERSSSSPPRGASGGAAFAPPGAHLQYLGGRIMSNIQVVQVLWGTGNFLPEITSTASPSVATFYQGVLNSAYVDWLTEYNTIGLPPPTSDQFLGRGSFSTQVQITPSPENGGATLDDLQIQAELSAQIAAGALPAPTHDAAGNNNTYYAVFFPHGTLITLGGEASCNGFCAYHSAIADAGGHGEIEYGVHPDFQPGSGCEFGCGAAATPFGNVTQVASHELVETMTDPEVSLATVFGPPLAWVDPLFSEIGDICNNQNGQVVGSDGITYDVQTEFSNSVNDCIVTNPAATPLVIGSAGETCRGTTAMASATVLGGPGRFTSDVTLSLASVGPPTPPGGEITASFDPNPVPTPPGTGATAAIRIASTPLTPPGSYTLTVQAQSAELTATSTTTLAVRSQLPGGPSPNSPASGANGVPAAATFAWSAVDQATQYELDVFTGGDCGGSPIRTFTTGGTTFTLPDDQALDTFQSFSWHVVAGNACGGGPSTTSACSRFQTASCTDPQELIANGGFEAGLASWTVALAVPPPIAGPANPHTGATAVLLGSVTGTTEPLGDSQISQTLTLAAGSTPKLSFWEWPLTTDSVTFDQQYVRVIPIDPPGAAVVLMNEVRNDQKYVLRQFDLTPFAGKTVALIFGVHQDGAGDITGMFVDDISVSSINCGPPDFALALAPVTTGEVCAGASLAFEVAVRSVNGPNFSSPVALTAGNLPPGATAVFADNPVPPGKATTLTLTTARPTPGSQFTITVTGTAVTPPPDATRTASAALLVDPNAPDAPEIASPRIGEVNVPRRPTLAWTSPFVPELTPGITAELAADGVRRAAPITVSQPGTFAWQLAATTPPGGGRSGHSPPALAGATPRGPSSRAAAAATPFAFGAASYRLQVARDAAFTNLVVDVSVATTSFTLPGDLDIATQYFWRVTATNACGTSAFSTTGSFIVGACFEGWGQSPPVPLSDGPSQSTVIGSTVDGKIYLIGGGLGAGPGARTDQVWAFDPLTTSWTRKADVPPPGAGSTFGSGVQLGGTIYLFGGVIGPPGPILVHRALWRYDIAANTWSRGADLPVDNFGAAVGAIGG